MNSNICKLFQEYIKNTNTMGIACALIEKNSMQYFISGKKSIKTKEPISEDSIFKIGSITKVFTTLALLEMTEIGQISLNDPIEKYLPGVRIPEINETKITLLHLATHTSGLPRLPSNMDAENLSNPYHNYTDKHLIDFLENHKLQSIPGEKIEYSNLGMGLLGHILSLKINKNYEELIVNNICKNLGMKNTSIMLNYNMQKNFAKGHHLKKEVENWDFSILSGAGALHSNLKDMALFLAANMGISNTRFSSLLKRCHEKRYPFSSKEDIGLGWIISSCDNNTKIIWHDGEVRGYKCFLGFDSKYQRGIIILSNSSEDLPVKQIMHFL